MRGGAPRPPRRHAPSLSFTADLSSPLPHSQVPLGNGANVVCGFNGGGTCVQLQAPYPEGACECQPNHAGAACERCAAGFFARPAGAPGFQCVRCSQRHATNGSDPYALECGYVQHGQPLTVGLSVAGAALWLLLFTPLVCCAPLARGIGRTGGEGESEGGGGHGGEGNGGEGRAEPKSSSSDADGHGLEQKLRRGEPLLPHGLLLAGVALLCAAPLYSATAFDELTNATCAMEALLPCLGLTLSLVALLVRTLIKVMST